MITAMQLSRPALTIVIPTLNRAHLVVRAVESALAQTSAEIEIIVSDNGSADETPSVLRKYRDPRLRHIRHESTISATAHGNFLIDEARGEFFLGLSDDDYIEPDFAARVLDLMNRRRELSFVYTGCLIHYGSIAVPALTGPETESGTDFIIAFFSGKREVCWCACVTRVADLRSIGPIPEGTICGDMFYWTKLAFQGDVGCLAPSLSHYTFMAADNLSSGTPVLKWGREVRMLTDEVLTRYGKSCTDPGEISALRKNCSRFVARSTANQFIWNTLRGLKKHALMQALPQCFPLFAGDVSVWPRVASALMMPRPLLKNLILKAAARRAYLREEH
jgi:glycosyltransferase involved in cell wall biosynthesis